MCGILGVLSQKVIDIEKFKRMRDTLAHRGPDDAGLFINNEKKVALGHRRLSIIDLSPLGKQPMSNEDRTVWLIFNGEIYNFKSIKKKLLELGHKFQSLTDSEVIIHGYEEWGVRVLDHLRGMFAFAIWDDHKKILFLARDRIGIKPLYYYKGDDKFIFASELKAIVEDKTIPREVNCEALKYYFMYTYIPAPYSIWNNIYKLLPGHFLILDNNNLTIKKYWDIKTSDNKEKESVYLKNLENIIKDSIKYRFISDVPVGILLSGGLDSSMVTAYGSKIKKDLLSFSVGFEQEEYSELKFARIVADKFGTNSIERILNSQKMKQLLDKILFFYDEPIGVSSIFPTFLLMEATSQNVKVSLSGDGGDEIFAGYTWYTNYIKIRRFNFLSWLFKPFYLIFSKLIKNPKNETLKKVMRKLNLLASNDKEKYRKLTTPRFEEKELIDIFNRDFLSKCSNKNIIKDYAEKGLKNIKDLQIFDMKTFLVDSILVKVDRASMAHSLEVRVPFLDHILIEYIMSLDPSIIFKNHEKKHILKKLAYDLLPKEIIHRKKKGFSAPLRDLGIFDNNIKYLKNSLLVKEGILNKKYIEKLFKSKIRYTANSWLLLFLELWYRKWKPNIEN